MKHLFKKQILFPLFLIAGILLQFSNAQAQFKFRDFTAYPAIPYMGSSSYIKIDSTKYACITKPFNFNSDLGLFIGDINGQVLSYTSFPNTNGYYSNNNNDVSLNNLFRDNLGNYHSYFYNFSFNNNYFSHHLYMKSDSLGNVLNIDSYSVLTIQNHLYNNHTFSPFSNSWVSSFNFNINRDNSNYGNPVTDSVGIRVINQNLSVIQDYFYPNSSPGAALIGNMAIEDAAGNYYLVIDTTISIYDSVSSAQVTFRPIGWRLAKFSHSGQLLWDQTLTNFNNIAQLSCPRINEIKAFGDKVVLSGIIVQNVDNTSLIPEGDAKLYACSFDTSGLFLNEFIDTISFIDPYCIFANQDIYHLSIMDTTLNGHVILQTISADSFSGSSPQPLIMEWNPVSGNTIWRFNPFSLQNTINSDQYFSLKTFFKLNGNIIDIAKFFINNMWCIKTYELDHSGNIVYIDSISSFGPGGFMKGDWFDEPSGAKFLMGSAGDMLTMTRFPARFTWCDSCSANLSGTAYIDQNNDCSLNQSLDLPVYYMPIEFDNAQVYTFTDLSGNYQATLSPGIHDLEITLPQPNYFYWQCQPNPLLVNAPLQPNISTGNDFAVSMLPNVHDIVTNVGLQYFGNNPGHNANYWIYLKNNGTVPESGLFEFTYTDSIFDFVSSNPAPDSIAPGYLAWNYSNMPVFSTIYKQITFYVPVTVAIGETYSYQTTAGNLSIDTFPNDNTYFFTNIISGPFDPNDKQVNPQGIGSDGFITTQDSLLKYTVRFQNTGTDTAINVRIEDIIDTDLDLSTIQFDFYTHNFTPLIYGRKLVLKFDNIFLPDSGADYNGSMGMIQYSIKQNPSLNPGTRIENYAAIYFDYNAPIFTNTTVNTITYPVNVIDSDPEKTSQIMVYPNPIEESVWLKWDFSPEDNFQSAEIYSLTGQSLVNLNDLFSGKPNGISDISDRCAALGSGIYLLQIKFENRTKTIKIVKF